MTEVAEQFLIDILTPQMAPVPVRRDVSDPQIARPIVIVAGHLDETYIPDGRYSVAKVALDVTLETQVGQSTDVDHETLISQISTALPNYGQWTGTQSYYEKVYFGPVRTGEKKTNDLVRSYMFGFYLVGRLTIP
jgi:hypothetical protein